MVMASSSANQCQQGRIECERAFLLSLKVIAASPSGIQLEIHEDTDLFEDNSFEVGEEVEQLLGSGFVGEEVRHAESHVRFLAFEPNYAEFNLVDEADV